MLIQLLPSPDGKSKLDVCGFVKLFLGLGSRSSGDSKSVNFDDFFLTRPLLDTPVTSKSN